MINTSNLLCCGHVSQSNCKGNRRSKTSGDGGGGGKKRQRIKVVYITNPMRVRTSASEFRALVQELTGQDSDMSRFSDYSDNNLVGNNNPTATAAPVVGGGDDVVNDASSSDPDHGQDQRAASLSLSYSNMPQYQGDELYDDDLFAPGMMDNFGAWLPTNALYGSS